MTEVVQEKWITCDEAKNWAQKRGYYGTLAGRHLVFYKETDRHTLEQPTGNARLNEENLVSFDAVRQCCGESLEVE